MKINNAEDRTYLQDVKMKDAASNCSTASTVKLIQTAVLHRIQKVDVQLNQMKDQVMRINVEDRTYLQDKKEAENYTNIIASKCR